VERLLEVGGIGVEQRVGNGPADVVHHQVEPAELVEGVVRQRGDGVEVHGVGRHDVRPSAEGLDPAGDLLELVSAAGREHDVGARLGQGQRAPGADAASGAGDHGDLSVHPEPVEHHPRNVTGSSFTG
jgi:hypothetical protein